MGIGNKTEQRLLLSYCSFTCIYLSGILILVKFNDNLCNVDALRTIIQATILGTWLGAIVNPLDWDRPWQAWPIPCIIGALLGYLIAHFVILLKILPTPKLHRKVHR
ncbi:hypothetical protein CAJAP_09173 [Camponotus japonicus]